MQRKSMTAFIEWHQLYIQMLTITQIVRILIIAALKCIFVHSDNSHACIAWECSVLWLFCPTVSVILSLQFNSLGPESCIFLRDLLLDPKSSIRSLQ